MRRGFTLLEMLVASAIFAIGATAAFSLFLAGVRMRSQADGVMRQAVGGTALVERIRLAAGSEANAPRPPEDYVGDGFAHNSAEVGNDMSAQLFRSPDAPNLWYLVTRVRDSDGRPDASDPGSVETTTLRFDILLLPLSQSVANDPDCTLRWVRDRILRDPNLTDAPAVIAKLVERGMAEQLDVTIVRRASWDR